MTPLPENTPVARGRALWMMAIGASVVLALIAVVAVAAFLSLDLVRLPEPARESGGASAPIVAPAPTAIRPELFSPPSEWDDRVG